MPDSSARRLLAALLEQASIYELLLDRCQEDGVDASTLARLAQESRQRVAEIQAEVIDAIESGQGIRSESDSELQHQIAAARTRYQDAISSVVSHQGELLKSIEAVDEPADPGPVESPDPGQELAN